MKIKLLLIITAFILSAFPIVSFGQAPTLGATSHFALFTAGGAFTSDGATVVTGDIASYTDIPVINAPGSIIGTIYGVGTASDPAFADVSIAFSNFGANGTVLGTPLETYNTTGFINPGTYHTTGAAAMNGNFTLDALGDPNAIFVININGSLTVGAGFNILLANNAQYCNVYWLIKGDFILGAGSVFRGTIISNGAITLNAGSNLYGRALTTAGAITLHNNIVSFTPAAAGTITGTLAQCPATAGQTYSITAVAGATTYTWLVPTGWSVTAGAGTNSITVTSGAAGQNGDITVTADNSCGTSAASSLAVTVTAGAPAVPGAITGSLVQCPATAGQAYSITAVAGATTYTWLVPTGWSVTAGAGTNSITVTSGAAGQNGDITVTAGNSCGTSAASSLAVIVGAPAVPGAITGTLAQCLSIAGETYSITAVAGATTYTWAVPAGWSITAGAGTNSITVTTGTIGQNGNITVTAGNSCGTSAVSSLAVTVNLSLVASVSIAAVPSGAICAGTSVTFTATPTNGGAPTYQWKSGGADIVGATNSTYTSAALVNTEAITVAMTSTLACASGSPATSNTVTMVVNPVLPASVTIAAVPLGAICAGTSVTFTATPVNGGAPTYVWKNGATVIAGETGSTYTSTTLANADVITVVMTSTEACASGSPATSNTVNMVVNPIVAASVTIAAAPLGAICAGTSVTFTATPVNGGAPTYVWKNGASVIAGETGSTYTSTTLANADAITVVMTSTAACVSGSPATSNIVDMVVGTIPSVPTFIITQPTCILPTGSVGLNGLPAGNWTLNPGSIAGNTVSTTVSGLIPGTYNYTVTNSTGCISAATADIVIVAPTAIVGCVSSGTVVTINAQPVTPSAPVATLIQPTCILPNGTITVTSPIGAGMTYSIDGLDYTNTTGIFTLPAGSYNLTAKNLSGCISTGTGVILNATTVVVGCISTGTVVTIIAQPAKPIAVPNSNTPVSVGGPINLTAVSVPGATYMWTGPNGFTSTLQNPVIPVSTPADAGVYSLTVTTATCSSAPATSIVAVNELDFNIPEGFSPNGDGINDFIIIRGIDYYPQNSIVIFNRWGIKVYEASPYKNDWDGRSIRGLKVGGDELPVGTYFYLLDLGDGSKVIKGTFYLNR